MDKKEEKNGIAFDQNINVNLFDEIERHTDVIYVLQHELDKIVPQHTHSQGHILVVQDGVATVNVGRSAYYIPIGYFVWIPPKVAHQVSFNGKKIEILNIYYPTSLVNDRFYNQVGVYPIPSLLYHIFELVKEQTVCFTALDWEYELLVTMNHVLPHIVQENKSQLRLPTTDHPVVLKILDAIHRNYQTQLTAQSISREVGLSVRSLSRYLRTELDVSFVQYVRTYRIVKAIQQIVLGEDSITNISYNVGYESLTAFSNSFYKVTGYRPSQFLK